MTIQISYQQEEVLIVGSYFQFLLRQPLYVGHITKNSTNVFSACRKRQLKETGRGDWESPPLYNFPQRQHERGELQGD